MNAATESSPLITAPLDRKRVYIVPTRYGIMLGVLLFAILLGSINYDNALGYILTFLLSGLFLVSMLHTYRNLAGLDAKRIAATPTFVGEQMHFAIKLDNPSNSYKLGLSLAALEKRKNLLRRATVLADCEVHRIDTRETLDTILSIPAVRRGWYEIPRIKISSIFPLGIFVAWGFFKNTRACLVYPKPEGQGTLPEQTTKSATSHAVGRTGDEDFRGLREYIPGEPVKRIAWKALAKTDELMSKQFGGDGDNLLLIDWQQTANLGDKEKRLSQLCLWVVNATRAQRAFGLILPGEVIDVDRGDAHQHRCLRALAEF